MSGNEKTFTCPLCGIEKNKSEGRPSEIISIPVLEIMRKVHADIATHDFVCLNCLSHYRTDYVVRVLEEEKGELSSIEEAVIESIKQQELLSKNINAEFESKLTFGERVADKVATFGGSWRFMIIFGSILFFWIIINSMILLNRSYDPYPYILLNLILSCLAAVQAPIIMMSQNRQEAKDRLRSEHDYQVNLKAELEIRHVNTKIDQLISHQWQRLLEIQKIQMELLEEMNRKNPDKGGR
jgi:uncharacterized membrane protein